jgi:23S rRNA (adenine2503-C2)-methyltransferase
MNQAIPQSESCLPQLDETARQRAILELSVEQLRDWLQQNTQPAFRAKQIRHWMIQRRITAFEQMTDLPLTLRQRLADCFTFSAFEVVRHQVARDRTEKLLLQLPDGEFVECVLMRDPGRRTVCVSTQVGCAMGCVFCASGLLGLKRNLSAAEILEQVLVLNRLMQDDEKITNVVVMGIGEPLANYDALMQTLKTLTSKDGFSLGARRITVSTVGLPSRIREFARSGQQFNLAISLHAPNDELRTELVPVNQNTGIADIVAAADDFFELTGRRISWEYVLLAGINDQPHHASQLADLLRGKNAHVNLIPMNGVSELTMAAPGDPATQRFREILERRHIQVTVRQRKGADIDAACGQLRLNDTHAKPQSVTLSSTTSEEQK